MNRVSNAAIAVVVVAWLASCAHVRDDRDAPLSASTAGPSSAHGFDDDPTISSFQRVVEVHFDGKNMRRESKGLVEHRRRLDEPHGVHFVFRENDLKHPVGFYTPSGKTFRYRVDSRGSVETDEIGALDPVQALRTLLEIDDEIELVDGVADSPKRSS